MKQTIYRVLMVFITLWTLSACVAVADLVGYDSAKLNAESATAYAQVVNENAKNVDRTSQTARRIHAVFQRLRPHADAINKTGHPFDWELTVIRNETLNAWVMPGGKIVFYTGLVEKLNLNDDEIAAIMGHEMVHALHEHAKAKVGQQVLTALAWSAASQAIASKTSVDVNRLEKTGAILQHFGLDLPFSRHHENEADEVGMHLMAKAGYHPQAGISLWQKMANHQENRQATVEFMSTHPSDARRIENIQRMMPELMAIYEANKPTTVQKTATTNRQSTPKKR